MNQKYKEKEKRLLTEKSIYSPLPGCSIDVTLAMLLHHCFAGRGLYLPVILVILQNMTK